MKFPKKKISLEQQQQQQQIIIIIKDHVLMTVKKFNVLMIKKNSTSGGDGERPQKRFHDHHLSGTGRGKEFKKKKVVEDIIGVKILIFQQIL